MPTERWPKSIPVFGSLFKMMNPLKSAKLDLVMRRLHAMGAPQARMIAHLHVFPTKRSQWRDGIFMPSHCAFLKPCFWEWSRNTYMDPVIDTDNPLEQNAALTETIAPWHAVADGMHRPVSPQPRRRGVHRGTMEAHRAWSAHSCWPGIGIKTLFHSHMLDIVLEFLLDDLWTQIFKTVHTKGITITTMNRTGSNHSL